MVETQHGILLHTMLNGEGYHFDAARPPPVLEPMRSAAMLSWMVWSDGGAALNSKKTN